MGNASWGNGHYTGMMEGLRTGRLQGGLGGLAAGLVLGKAVSFASNLAQKRRAESTVNDRDHDGAEEESNEE